jgi:Zn/Cd-binding protein ZinT
VTGSSYSHAGCATLTEDNLNSGITIHFRRFDLRNTVVRYVQHGHRDRVPIIREDAHHANLATEEAKAHFFSIPTYDWAGLC